MSSPDKKIALVTGANGGLGFAIVEQLLKDATYHVLLGSRSVDKGEAAVKELQSRNLPGTLSLLQLDVVSDESINQAAEYVRKEFGRLDCLVNNAGVSGLSGDSKKTREAMRLALETNAIGTALVGDAFAGLLRYRSNGTSRIVNVSSSSGSIAGRFDESSPSYKMPGTLQYRMSKAALNMVSAEQFVMLGPDVKVFTCCPGFVASNFSDMNTAANGAKPAIEAALLVVDFIKGKRDEDAGRFVSSQGLLSW